MKLHFELDCNPDDLTSVLALISPFISKNTEEFHCAALPQALMDLGEILEQYRNELEGVTWSGDSWELIDSFIFSMSNYRKRATFNRIEWAEEFLDQLAQLGNEYTSEPDRAVFHVIQVVVKEIEQGRVGVDQFNVYTNNGIPLSFPEWASHLLTDKVNKTEIARAHWNMVDPERLIQLLHQWQIGNLSKTDYQDENIAF